MGRENFANFATAALATTSLSASALSFTVATGLGSLFPTGNFIVDIDTELILISSRSGDTFTVASGGRGFDGTSATTHTVAASAVVQLSICRYNLVHLWSNVADTYNPQVPPVQIGNTPSVYDTEFEGTDSWVLGPSPASGTTFDVGTHLYSHLVFNRAVNDNTTYTAYIPYTLSGAFTVTARISDASSFLHQQSADQAQVILFASDQDNPVANPVSGNQFLSFSTLFSTNDTEGGTYQPARTFECGKYTGGFQQLGSLHGASPLQPVYLRITYDGSGNWVAYAGDGYTYWSIAAQTTFLTAPRSLGLRFLTFLPSHVWMNQTAVVDYVHVVVGRILPPYGG